MNKKTVVIPNMSCGHCVHTIESELGELNGIQSAKANLESKSVDIEWTDPLDWAKIASLLTEINYPPAQ